MSMHAYYAGAVARGAKLLDEAKPTWAQDIDLPTLDLSDVTFCMLGQLYGFYSDGRYKLSETLTKLRIEFEKSGRHVGAQLSPEHYGFEALGEDPEDHYVDWNRNEGYSMLTEMWTEIIRQRRDFAELTAPRPAAEVILTAVKRDCNGRFSKRA